MPSFTLKTGLQEIMAVLNLFFWIQLPWIPPMCLIKGAWYWLWFCPTMTNVHKLTLMTPGASVGKRAWPLSVEFPSWLVKQNKMTVNDIKNKGESAKNKNKNKQANKKKTKSYSKSKDENVKLNVNANRKKVLKSKGVKAKQNKNKHQIWTNNYFVILVIQLRLQTSAVYGFTK